MFKSKITPGLFSIITALASAMLTALSSSIFASEHEYTWVIITIALCLSFVAAYVTVADRNLHPELPKQVFIIYAHPDIHLALEVSHRLREAGFEPWLDVERIKAGQRWRPVIEEALTQSGSAVAILTKEFTKGSPAELELSRALETIRPKRKDAAPVIPIVLDEAPVPESLRDVQYVRSMDDKGMEQLIKGLRYTTGVSASESQNPQLPITP